MGEYIIRIVAFAGVGLLTIATIGYIVESCQIAWNAGNKVPTVLWMVGTSLTVGLIAALCVQP